MNGEYDPSTGFKEGEELAAKINGAVWIPMPGIGHFPMVENYPVFREFLTPGQDALMVPVDDAPSLASALASVLDHPDLAANLRAAALATAQRFTWAQSAAEHQAIYASIARM